MSNIQIKLAAGTDTGLLRQNNEDNFCVCSDLQAQNWTVPQEDDYIDLGQYGALLLVADGMGGANAGEVASATVVETIKQEFVPEKLENTVASDACIEAFLHNVVKLADQNILDKSTNDSSTQGMGTTVILVWLIHDNAYLCWCGDSRCYVFNHNVGLTKLSKDHSFVQELIDNGELDAKYAADHPYSNVITRCLGDQGNRSDPDIRTYELQDEDVLLLCSDGLTSQCTDEEIIDILTEHWQELEVCKDELISAALASGGYDNITVALSAIKSDKPFEVKDSELAKTIRVNSIGRRYKQVFAILLLAIIAIGIYLWSTNDYPQFTDNLNAFVHVIIVKAKSLFQ